MARYGFYLTILLALVTLVFSGAMANWGQSIDEGANGYARSIFALYFSRDLGDLAFISGADGAAMRAELMRIQVLDHYYPFAYGGMAMVFFAALGLSGTRLAWLGVVLGALAIGADLAENEVANRILADLDEGADPTERLDAMWGHSWIKWGFIGAYAAWMGVLMLMQRRRLLAVFPMFAVVGSVAAYVTAADPAVFNWAYQLLIPFMLTFPVAAIIFLREQ